MVRYCSCSRGIGYSNRTSVVRNGAGYEVCSHCGGFVPPQRPYDYDPYTNPDGMDPPSSFKTTPWDFDNDLYERYCEKAELYSIGGNHSAAIETYKKAVDFLVSGTEYEMLAAIADEYEAIGDYSTAEDYWRRCCAIAPHDSIYEYIAQKGDFLYRRKRYGESIAEYEKAMKMIKDKDGKKFTASALKYYARVTHFIILAYGVLGEINREEEFHSELKHQISRYIIGGGLSDEINARHISRTAWEIYNEDRMYDEALILVDFAIKLYPTDEDYERKAVFIKDKLKISVIVKDITSHDLDMINEALKILPKDKDNAPYLKVKADILDLLGDLVNARICRALAYKDYETVDTVERQLKKLKHSGTYINITGINFYKGFKPFREGTIVDLIREPDNPHDSDAIRVDVGGETVGYVANSKYTVIKEVKSATEIKNTRSTQAEVQFILFNEWVIAKLI